MSHTPLSAPVTLRNLLRFTLPTIIVMIFMSTYSIVDGIFVARFVGTNALSAVNIVFPLFSFLLAVGIMLATGVSAVCGFQMGEGNEEEARKSFTFIVLVGTVLGILIAAVGLGFTEPIVKLLGANEALLQDCIAYTKPLAFFDPFAILQLLFQYLFVTAGKPNMGLVATILGGTSNLVLEYVCIVPMDMGIQGAALATSVGFIIPAIIGVLYFTFYRKGTLYFVKPSWSTATLQKSCSNGISEMVTNLSAAVTTFLFNIIMMRLVGEDGVAAITIVLYTQFLTTALYLGYASGVAPMISYNYGNDHRPNLKNIFRFSMLFIGVSSVVVFLVALLIADPIVQIFAPVGTAVHDLALRGYYIYIISVLFSGVNIFASAMFTAYSNGKISAIISLLRTFVFLAGALVTLPLVLGVDGVWIAVPFAEIITLLFAIYFFVKKKKVYHYGAEETQ